jgi:hypothetical protein
MVWRIVRLVLPGLEDDLAGSTWFGGWSGMALLCLDDSLAGSIMV